jgi:hypothetical protein
MGGSAEVLYAIVFLGGGALAGIIALTLSFMNDLKNRRDQSS